MAPKQTQSEGQTPDFVASAVSLMRAQLGSELTVADLADHVGYSRFHFSRLFTGVTGLAPMEYCAALRFAEAKRLLLTTDEPVVDVCAEVGFTSLSTFSVAGFVTLWGRLRRDYAALPTTSPNIPSPLSQ